MKLIIFMTFLIFEFISRFSLKIFGISLKIQKKLKLSDELYYSYSYAFFGNFHTKSIGANKQRLFKIPVGREVDSINDITIQSTMSNQIKVIIPNNDTTNKFYSISTTSTPSDNNPTFYPTPINNSNLSQSNRTNDPTNVTSLSTTFKTTLSTLQPTLIFTNFSSGYNNTNPRNYSFLNITLSPTYKATNLNLGLVSNPSHEPTETITNQSSSYLRPTSSIHKPNSSLEPTSTRLFQTNPPIEQPSNKYIISPTSLLTEIVTITHVTTMTSPTLDPTDIPSIQLTTSYPTSIPTPINTFGPSVFIPIYETGTTTEPSDIPTNYPVNMIELTPSLSISAEPSLNIEVTPTNESIEPSDILTIYPTEMISLVPSFLTSSHPMLKNYTQEPSDSPSLLPSTENTKDLSPIQTIIPTTSPVVYISTPPTFHLTKTNELNPSIYVEPTSNSIPTYRTTNEPSDNPTIYPTSYIQPSSVITTPSIAVTSIPSDHPTTSPSTNSKTTYPSIYVEPISVPISTHKTTNEPTDSPTIYPTSYIQPSILPSDYPTRSQSTNSIITPTQNPTILPICIPTSEPTLKIIVTTEPTDSTTNTLTKYPTIISPLKIPTNYPSLIIGQSITPSSPPSLFPTTVTTNLIDTTRAPTISSSSYHFRSMSPSSNTYLHDNTQINFIISVQFNGVENGCKSLSNNTRFLFLLTSAQIMNISISYLHLQKCYYTAVRKRLKVNLRSESYIISIFATLKLSDFQNMLNFIPNSNIAANILYQYFSVKLFNSVSNGDYYSYFQRNSQEKGIFEQTKNIQILTVYTSDLVINNLSPTMFPSLLPSQSPIGLSEIEVIIISTTSAIFGIIFLLIICFFSISYCKHKNKKINYMIEVPEKLNIEEARQTSFNSSTLPLLKLNDMNDYNLESKNTDEKVRTKPVTTINVVVDEFGHVKLEHNNNNNNTRHLKISNSKRKLIRSTDNFENIYDMNTTNNKNIGNINQMENKYVYNSVNSSPVKSVMSSNSSRKEIQLKYIDEKFKFSNFTLQHELDAELEYRRRKLSNRVVLQHSVDGDILYKSGSRNSLKF